MSNALEHFDAAVGDAAPALFLDFDGTLSEIAPKPTLAVLRPSVREALRRLVGGGVPVALVSGRDLDDLRRRVDLPGVAYAGSLGFDMLGPPPASLRHQPGAPFLPTLDAVEEVLREELATVEGVFMERKRFAFAVHYRQVAPPAIPAVLATVRAKVATHAGVQIHEGKMVLEMLPQLNWHKGSAVLWLREQMQVRGSAIYLGDDRSDEDAFAVMAGWGVGIVVQESPIHTAATFRLRDTTEVEQFLWRLVARFAP